MIKLNHDYEKIYTNIIEHIVQYIREHKIRSLVVGLSGGIDSTLTAALAKQVKESFIKFGSLNRPRIIGISIPSMSNHQSEIDRAKRAGEAFCDDFRELGKNGLFLMDYILGTFTSNLKPYNILLPLKEFFKNRKSRKHRIGRANFKARIRMAILYDVAHHNNGMVLSTDNYTEYLLGFWALHGDVGDFGMIQNLFKTEVYGLAKYVSTRLIKSGWRWWILPHQIESLRECSMAVPTAGLGLGTDMSELGAENYSEVDNILLGHINDTLEKPANMLEGAIRHRIIERHKKSEYKRHNPYNIPREDLLK